MKAKDVDLSGMSSSELSALQLRCNNQVAKTYHQEEDLIEEMIPKARLKKLISASRKCRGYDGGKSFRVPIAIILDVYVGWSDDCDDVGVDWRWEKVHDSMTTAKVIRACPDMKKYLDKLVALDIWVSKEVRAICKEYKINGNFFSDYLTDRTNE